MTSDDPRHQQLVDWLQEEGHSESDIRRILARLDEYDRRTVHESIFDSIDAGDFDLGALIDEVLGDK